MSQGASLTSLLSSLNNDTDNSTFIINTGIKPSIFIDRQSNVGINTTAPSAQLEVSNESGSCLRMRRGTSSTAYASMNIASNGNLEINPNASGSEITSTKSLNLVNHDGESVGLKLAGSLVEATAEQLNYVAVAAGEAVASKAVILDSSSSVSGINTIEAANIGGVLTTAAQPNITSLGELTSLTVSGELIIDGSITLNGTSGGIGGSAELPSYIENITGGTAAASKAMVLDANKNISGVSSIGTSAIVVNGSTIGSEASYLAGAVAGTAASSKAVVLNSSGSVNGINSLSATSLSGTLQTASQPNITSTGTLTSLTVDGDVLIDSESNFALTVSGGFSVEKNANIGANLTVGGNLIVNGTTTSVSSNAISIDDNTLILNASPAGPHDTGIIVNRYQTPNNLATGNVIADIPTYTTTTASATSTTIVLTAGSEVDGYYKAWWVKSGNQVRKVNSYVGSTKTITVETAFTTTPSAGSSVDLFGKSTASFVWDESNRKFRTVYGSKHGSAELQIISDADLATANLTSSGTINVLNTASASSTSTGSFKTAGGVGIAKSLHVGDGIFGTIQTASQPNITSVGTLGSLSVSGEVVASQLTGALQTASQPNITEVGTLGSLTVTGGVVASQLTGTLQTAAQTNITSVGTLGSLTVTNGITAAQLTGTLQTAAQTNITSVGNLSSVSIAGSTIASEAAFLAGAVAGSAANSKVVVLDNSRSVSGINALSATSLSGTLQTGAQTNITSVGNLSSVSIAGSTIASEAAFLAGAVAGSAVNSKVLVLNNFGSVSGINSLSATSLIGTLQTNDQPNITSLGPLSSLSIAGITISSEIGLLTGITAGAAANGKVLTLNSSGAVSGITSLSATNLTGTLQTASQTNITSVGTLGSLTVTNGITAATLTGELQTALQPKITTIGTLTSLAVTNGITAATLTGTLQTESQTNITAVGTLNSLTVTNGITASTLTGTLQTGSQTNITAVGTLNSLAVTNGITASTLTGTLQTGSQTNITAVGTLGSLSVTNDITAATLTGEIQTAAQTKITSIGALTSVSIAGSVIGSEAAFLSGAVAGTAANNKVLVLNNSGSISGIASISATSLTGELQTASQTKITSVGTLSSLSVTNDITAATLTGEIQTAAQTKITSIGALISVSIAGSVIGSEAAFLSGAVAGTAANNKVLVLNNSGAITGISSLTATNITGTLQTAAQTNITSIGPLTTVSIAGSTITSEAAFLSGAVAGTAANSKALVLNASGAITGIGSLSATNLTGTLQTAAQTNITSVGTLTGLTVSGATSISSTTDASSSTSGGALTVSGGLAVAKSMYIGTDLQVTGSIFINGTQVTAGGGGGGGDPNGYLTVTPGTATASKALVLDASRNISNINTLATNNIETNGSVSSIGGINWTTQTGAISQNWNSVCWSSEQNLFVAVGSNFSNNAQVIYSSDGITWSNSVTNMPTQDWSSVIWIPERRCFSAISTSGTNRYAESSNGISWATLTPAPAAQSWISQAWSPQLSRHVVFSSNGSNTLMTREGGGEWTLRSVSNGNIWSSVCWSPERSIFVAVASAGGSGNRAMTSPDGISWQIRSTPIGSLEPTWTSVCWAAELSLFVAVASSGTNNRVMTSPDGNNWTPRTPAANNNWTSVCWAPELSLLVAVASSGTNTRVMTSPDGINWTLRTSSANTSWNSVCWSPELCRFVAVSLNTLSNNPVMTSTHTTASSFVLANNTPVTGVNNSSKLGISADVFMRYRGGLNGGHFWSIDSYNGTTTTTNIEIMRLNRTGLGIGVKNPHRPLDILGQPNGCLRLRNTVMTPCDLSVDGNGNLVIGSSSALLIPNITSSSSTTTGALRVSGGVGIAGTINAAGMTSSGDVVITSNTFTNTSTAGALRVTGGIGVGGNICTGQAVIANGSISTSSTTASTSTTTGALTVAGGAGIGGALYVGGAGCIGNIGTPVAAFSVLGTASYVSASFQRLTQFRNNNASPITAELQINSGPNTTATNAVVFGTTTNNDLQFMTNANTRMTISASGLVGIATTSPIYPLHINATTSPTNSVSYAAYKSDNGTGQVGVVTSPSSVSLFCSGRVVCTGELNVISDIRAKENITILSSDIVDDFINQIAPKVFNYKTEQNKITYGYIAQDLLKSGFVDLISIVENAEMKKTIDDDGFESPEGIQFSVTTGNIIPILHLKVKQLSDENADLKQDNKELKQMVLDLMARVETLESV